MAVLQSTYLLLDSTETFGGETYATILARLQTANVAEVNYTITDTELSLPGGDADVADLRLVDCLIPNAERTAGHAAGDISGLHRDNIDTAFFRMELSTDEVIPIMAPDMLGRTDRDALFVRPATGTGSFTGAGHGDGHGKTWRDAIDGFEDAATIGANWAVGTTYWICDFIAGVQAPAGGFVHTLDPDFQNAAGAPTRWRMDYPLDPGMLFLGSIDTRGTNNAFTQPDAGGFPRVWNAAFSVAGTGGRRWLTPMDPTVSTTDLYTNYIFKDVDSQAALEAEEMTRWEDSGVLWVHMPDDTDPSDRIAGGNPAGYMPAHGYMVDSPGAALEDLEFINCQMIGESLTGSGIMTKDSDGFTGEVYPKTKFLGGRYTSSASWKPRDVCLPGTEWGRSTDGNVLWDTSDRPDPAADPCIAKAVAKGSDQAVWNEMGRFLEIDSAQEGIYWFHAGLTDNPDDGTVSGVLARYIGDAHPVLQAKTGDTTMNDDGDSHAFGNQGASNWDIGFIYVHNAGSAFNYYSITDSTGAQNIQNNSVHDFVIRDSHQKFLVGAGQNAIYFNGDGGVYLRTNGSGLYAGNQILRGCIANIIGDPDGQTFGNPAIIADGGAIRMHLPTEVFVDSVHFVNCTHVFDGQLNADMSLGDGGVTNPERGGYVDQQFRAHNCTFEKIVERIIYQRATKWNNAYKTIVSITKADPCVVEITGHGFPDIAQGDVFVEPEVYFDNMLGMTELAGNEYKAVWIDADTFSLKTIAGVAVDSTGFGTFTSGDCQRSNAGYIDLQDNTIILKPGQTAADDIYRYNLGNQTLAELQALTRRTLPGAHSTVLEAGTVIE